MMTLKTSKRGPHHLPEIALYRGPVAVGVVGVGSYADLFGYQWALAWDAGRGLVMLKNESGVWAEQTSPEPLPVLKHTDRHLTAQSDQAGRPTIAWERKGEVLVWFWNPITTSFELENLGPGVDPVLLMDAQLNGITYNSDVVLFYLHPDRRSVRYRLQRDRWATEYTLAALPEPMYLDQAVALAYRYELWLSSDATPSHTLRSALYPVDVGTERLAGAVEALDGFYLPARLDASASEALAGQITPRPGVYALAVIRANPATEALNGQITPLNGSYYL